MKTTNKHISTITEESRKKHNDKCQEDYYKNQDKYKMIAKLNYYKNKFGNDIILKFIEKYGANDDCIAHIKKATKKTVQIAIEDPEN
jgi:hypothetical protein